MNKIHTKFVLPILLILITLSGCTKVSDIGVHHCQDGKLDYNLKMYSGEHKGYRDSSSSTSTDVILEVKKNNLLGIHFKVNGFNQSYDDRPYESTTTLMEVSYPFEETITDPSTNKKWISDRLESITVDIKTGELKSTITEKHLDMKKNVTSMEKYTMTSRCN
jgi:hypothetical protein